MRRLLYVAMCLEIIMTVAIAHGENPRRSLNVTATDFNFSPRTMAIESGKAISFSFTNQGVQDHEWVILKPDTEVTLPFNEDDEGKVFWEIEAKPGATVKSTFMAPSNPGTYTIVCGKPRHIERGMTATLVVE